MKQAHIIRAATAGLMALFSGALLAHDGDAMTTTEHLKREFQAPAQTDDSARITATVNRAAPAGPRAANDKGGASRAWSGDDFSALNVAGNPAFGRRSDR